MPEATLVALAKPLVSVAKVVWPSLRKLHAEKLAGKTPFAHGTDLLEKGLDETFARLRGGSVDDAWWKSLPIRVGHQLITPEFLRKPALHEWLSNESVQADFKTLARARLLGAEVDDVETTKRLRKAFSDSTGEDKRRANGPIGVVVAVLAAGYLGSIDQRLKPIVAMVQAGVQENRAGFETMEDRFDDVDRKLDLIGPDQHLVKAHSETASKELSMIRKRRSLDIDGSREKSRILAQRVTEGDLCHADSSVKVDVLYWAARLHAARAETLSAAKSYLTKIHSIDPTEDTRIVDATILELEEGAADNALQTLRDIDDPDGRAKFFLFLSRANGETAALEWFDQQADRDDPDFLTGIGWSNVASHLANAGRWDEAVGHLAAAKNCLIEWPDLAFIEGVINAAMLLPEELRQYALKMDIFHPTMRTIEGAQADELRLRAHACFASAESLMNEIDHEGRASAARHWRLWLRLTDPKSVVVKAARLEVQEGMKEGGRAVELVPFARAFGIEFDAGPLKRYLGQRKKFGGLDTHDLFAELQLAQLTMSSQDLVDFLEQEEDRLSQVMSKAALTGTRIEALIEGGQIIRARSLLTERAQDLAKHDNDRFQTMIDLREGVDPRDQLEELYLKTGLLLDLQNLIAHLHRVSDWGAMAPLLEELFHRESTVDNAANLVTCFHRNPATGEGDVVAFLDKNGDLVARSYDLTSAKAWALCHMGRLTEARSINDELLGKRHEVNDLSLDINLALQSGEWERFPAIVEREWERREEHRADILIRLASLVAETDSGLVRTMELAKLAVSKAPTDPYILVEAYALAVQLGCDGEEETEWISRAVELSSDDGPAQKVDFRTMAENMVPAYHEQALRIEKDYLAGNIPLHVAATVLNEPLSRLLIDLPRRNADQKDGRQRAVLPIVSGARSTVDVQVDWTIGIDLTSLMVFAHVGLLRETLDAFHRVMLSPDTMLVLLDERRRARFHQPSRIKSAEEIRQLIDEDLLQAVASRSEPPQWLVDEVGPRLAELLQEAQETEGCVVCPRPIHKPSTYMEAEAELGDYGALVQSTTAFARALFDRGHVDTERYERAYRYLLAHDRDESKDTSASILDGPLYLHDLTVTYLQVGGMLQAACHRDLDLRIHPLMRAEQDALITANREGEKLANALNEVRIAVRGALEDDKVAFLPRRKLVEGEDTHGKMSLVASAGASLFRDVGPCDAICVDDRAVNRYTTLTDETGRALPIVCVLDVLRQLEADGSIDTAKKWSTLHRLRCAGFALLPLDLEELEHRLRGASLDDAGSLIETAELRVLRQTLMRIRSLDMVTQPLETRFLDNLRLVCVLAIRRIWGDDSVPAERAVAVSDWVWRNLSPSPLDWSRTIGDPTQMVSASDAFVQHVALLLKPMAIKAGERRTEFQSWVERGVLEPLLPANPDLVDDVTTIIRADIEALVEEMGNDEIGVDS